jgi:hypothetical protein
VRGRSWCLEEVWTHFLQLLMNRHENGHSIFPMLASMFGGCSERWLDDFPGAMFGGCSEQWLDDFLGAWLYLVQTQVRGVE